MSEYGAIFSTDDIKKQLLHMNRDYTGRKSWEKLYGDIDLAKQQQLNAASADYSQAMSDAYASAYANKASLASGNLGQGYKTAVDEELDVALENAYDSYRANYLAATADIESTTADAVANVDAALTEQADYTKRMSDKPYEYLQYLFDKYGEGAEENNIFYTDELWKRYTYEETDENGDPTGQRKLKTWDEIVGFGTKDDETGEWLGLRDADGNLTLKGVDFYDQMLNYFDSAEPGAGSGFGSWLAENDSELFDWSQSYNPYNYTDAGTNAGSFKTMFGLTSTDQTYSFIERFGGYTKQDVDNMYVDFAAKGEELAEKLANNNGANVEDITSGYEDLTNEIKTVADQLGITESLEQDMGMSFDELAVKLANLDSKSIEGARWITVGTTVGASTAGLAAGTTAVSALLGTGASIAAVPVVGWIVGAVLAVAAGLGAAYGTSKSIKQGNLAAATESKNAYNNLLTGLIEYSQFKRQETQTNYYSKNK